MRVIYLKKIRKVLNTNTYVENNLTAKEITLDNKGYLKEIYYKWKNITLRLTSTLKKDLIYP